jgi:REP element-mobilizing transposase RayT
MTGTFAGGVGSGSIWVDVFYFGGRRYSATVENQASQNLYGLREYVDTDDELCSDNECNLRAQALLDYTKPKEPPMTSKPRIIVSHRYYQISTQSIPELSMFREIQMKEFFLKQLSITLQNHSFDCLAWSLLDDHYHLIIKTADYSLPLFMQRFNSILAKQFNKINHRKGTVFSKRYSSIVIQDGKSLNDSIRHIHLNPVRRGVCSLEELDSYQWTGHKSILTDTPDTIINAKELLKQFGNSDSLECYKNFIRTGAENDEVIRLIRMSNRATLNFRNSNCFVIGDKKFTDIIIQEDVLRKARIARYIRENMTIDKMLQKVRAGIYFEQDDIFRRGKLNEISTARQLFAVIAHCNYEYKCIDLANYLGITDSAISSMVSRRKRIIGLEFLKEMIGT